MHEGGGWSPKSLARTITRDLRHVTPPTPKIAVSSSGASDKLPAQGSNTPQERLERRSGPAEHHRARLNTTEHPARPRPDRQGRSRQGWLIWAEKGLEMRPVGAPHGVALRHFLRNKGLAAGLVPIMADCGA